MTLESFASGFWDYEGEYIQRKIARGGHFSKVFAQMRAGQVENWILPHLKKNRPQHPSSSDRVLDHGAVQRLGA